jgi:hypothetical protein
MKRCPACHRAYTDESLRYCLDDGTLLQGVPDSSNPSFDPQATIAYQPVETSAHNRAQGQQTIAGDRPPPNQQPHWTPMPQQAAPARRIWPWVLGIVAALIILLVGGIGLLAMLIYIGSRNENGNSNNRNTNVAIVSTNANRKAVVNANVNSSSSDTAADLFDDFSEQKWWTGSDSNGRFWYQNGEYHATAVPGRFVVEYAPEQSPYYTKDATVTVTTRAVYGLSPAHGYGVVVHGQMTNNHLEDYAFLIKSDENPSYAIALHKGGSETFIRSWTRSDAIHTGLSGNQLQIVTNDGTLSLYINGDYVDSITDSAGYKTGRVGVYTSDTSEVAFDNLSIKR